MKLVKSLLMGTSVVVLAGLIVTMALPKAAHAIVATAVNVVNTTANPVPASSIDEPGRAPYVSSVLDLANTCAVGFECDFNFTQVPAGHRLVIQEISGFIQFNYSPGAWIEVFLSASGATFGEGQFIINGTTFGNLTFGGTRASFTQPFHGYFDAGATPVVSVQARNGSFPSDNSTEVATLKGYLIDCSAAPCAAFVH